MGAALFYLICFGAFMFQGLAFYNPDHLIGSYVFFESYFRSFSETGSFPLWNAYHQMGVGSVANPLYGILYPIHYLQLLVGPLFYFRFGWLLHIGLLGAGLYRWRRSHVVSLLLCSSLALLFLSSNFVFLYAVTWSIWLLGELECADRSNWRIALFAGLLVTTGEPFTLFIVFTYVLLRQIAEKRWSELLVLFVVVAAAGFLVFGPSLMASPYTSRRGGLSEAEALAFSFHPGRILTFFSPYFYGYHPYRTFHAGSVTNHSPYFPRFYFDTVYLCLPLVGLIFAAGAKALRKKDWPLGGALLIAFGVAFGKWGMMPILHELPPFSMLRHPEKAMNGTLLLLTLLLLKYFVTWGELLQFRKIPAFLAVLALVPFFSFSHEWSIGILSVVFVMIVVGAQYNRISVSWFSRLALGIGLLQSFIAFPRLITVPANQIAERSAVGERVLQMVPPGGWQRLEFAPGSGVGGPPSMALVGVNSLYRVAAFSGYEAIETPFLYDVGNRMLGSASRTDQEKYRDPISVEEMERVVQLTNLRLVVGPERGLTSHLSNVVSSKAFSVDTFNYHTFIAPRASSSALHWFRKLRPQESTGDLTSWPPRYDPNHIFWNGLERSSPDSSLAQESSDCSSKVGEIAFSESSLRKINENHWIVKVEVPCGGWIFLSSNLYPGWSLHSGAKQVALRRLNQTFMGFYVPAGSFEGEFTYSPYRALWRSLLPHREKS